MKKLVLKNYEFICDESDDFGYNIGIYYIGNIDKNRYKELKNVYKAGDVVNVDENGSVWNYEILGFLDSENKIKLFEL